jgi:hypothetical protein
VNLKHASADSKWEVRVKEYESRLKAAEERMKRERQGSKERVAELENNLKLMPSFFILFCFVFMYRSGDVELIWDYLQESSTSI